MAKNSFKIAWLVLILLAILGIGAIFFVTSGSKGLYPMPSAIPEERSITILWAEWKPTDYLKELVKDFSKETGIKVKVVQEPWASYQKVFFDEMGKKGRAFDMVVGDSQWLGRGVTEGHYVEITKWMVEKGVDKTMTEAAVMGYSEYPKWSGHYWAVPFEGDAMGFAYRKDLFEDPKEKEAFKARYGYPLDAPKTWAQLRDIAEFFYRPDKDFYGITVWCEKEYDGITMGVDTLIWAWGAELGNYKTFKVNGILNTKEGIAALEEYKKIYKYSSPEWKNAYIETNQALMKGKVAMVMSYFAFFQELLDPAKNPYLKDTGFFANPGGPAGRFSSLGGQGISIVSYSKKKDLCLKFLEWFIREDVQGRWADLGGFSCNKKVLNSDRFLKAAPFNEALMESMQMVRDFWTVPEYPRMLSVSQKYWYEYVTTDNITAEEAMNAVAKEWEEILEYSGYYKE
jgi:multiple sugar transport system substrate-binding protein